MKREKLTFLAPESKSPLKQRNVCVKSTASGIRIPVLLDDWIGVRLVEPRKQSFNSSTVFTNIYIHGAFVAIRVPCGARGDARMSKFLLGDVQDVLQEFPVEREWTFGCGTFHPALDGRLSGVTR